MAKGNLFLGMARGKVGSVVFSRLEGKQVSRAYNSQVANPKSLNQRIQRAVFATATRAAKFMSSIVDHSFFGVKDGAKCLRRFVELNSKYLLQQYNAGAIVGLNPKGVNMLMPAPYKVSTGNLGTLIVPQLTYGGQGGADDTNLPLGGFGLQSGFAEGVDILNSIGAQPGDQLSCVAIIGKVKEDHPTETQLLKSRVVFSSTAKTASHIDITDAEALVPAIFDPSIANDGVIKFAEARDAGWFCVDVPEGYVLLAGTWILSRYDSNKKEWDYSEQTMLVWEDMNTESDAAIASYANGATAPTSDYFLDGADTSVVTEDTNDSPYPSYATIVVKNADGDNIASKTVYNTGGALQDVTLEGKAPARLIIVSSKVRGAGYPGIRLTNEKGEDVASQDPNATNNIEFDIELNPAAAKTTFTARLASRFQGADTEAVVSTFNISVNKAG